MDRIEEAKEILKDLKILAPLTLPLTLKDKQVATIGVLAMLLIDIAESLRKIAIGTSNINPEK